MQQPGPIVTKSKLRKSILDGGLSLPFFAHEEVITWYAQSEKMDITDARDRLRLDAAIVATGHLSPTAVRTLYGDFCDAKLKTKHKTVADLPLVPAGQGVSMDADAFKTLGQNSTFAGAAFDLSFDILSDLYKDHSMAVTATTHFDGYLPQELVVWFLLQVALDKKLVRTGVCVYALRLAADEYFTL